MEQSLSCIVEQCPFLIVVEQSHFWLSFKRVIFCLVEQIHFCLVEQRHFCNVKQSHYSIVVEQIHFNLVEQSPFLIVVEQNHLLLSRNRVIFCSVEQSHFCVVEQSHFLVVVEQSHFWFSWNRVIFCLVEQSHFESIMIVEEQSHFCSVELSQILPSGTESKGHLPLPYFALCFDTKQLCKSFAPVVDENLLVFNIYPCLLHLSWIRAVWTKNRNFLWLLGSNLPFYDYCSKEFFLDFEMERMASRKNYSSCKSETGLVLWLQRK